MLQPVLLDTLLIVGTIALINAFVDYQIYLIRWLPDHGRQITALVTSIRHETGKSAWGISRDIYHLTATWTNPHTGRTYTFWSWIIHSSPAYTKGSLVPVLIDPKNPKRYALNLSWSRVKGIAPCPIHLHFRFFPYVQRIAAEVTRPSVASNP
jgi:hypothetical protein